MGLPLENPARGGRGGEVQPPLLRDVTRDLNPPPPSSGEQIERGIELLMRLKAAGLISARLRERLVREIPHAMITGWLDYWESGRRDGAEGPGALAWRIEHGGEPPAAAATRLDTVSRDQERYHEGLHHRWVKAGKACPICGGHEPLGGRPS